MAKFLEDLQCARNFDFKMSSHIYTRGTLIVFALSQNSPYDLSGPSQLPLFLTFSVPSSAHRQHDLYQISMTTVDFL